MDGFFFFFGPIGTGNFRLCFQLGQMIKRRKRMRNPKIAKLEFLMGAIVRGKLIMMMHRKSVVMMI